MKHTVAPWYGRVQSSGQGLVMAANGQNVAVVYDGEADTALVAAAPELLEALQTFCEAYDTRPTCDPNALEAWTEYALRDIRDKALAAICKAEGDA